MKSTPASGKPFTFFKRQFPFDVHFLNVYFDCRSKSGNGRGSLAYVVSTSDEKNENSNGSSEKFDDKGKDSADGEKSSTSCNGGRVTRSSQRAAATAAHSAPTSGQNSANQSPTSSPTDIQTNQTPSPGNSTVTTVLITTTRI